MPVTINLIIYWHKKKFLKVFSIYPSLYFSFNSVTYICMYYWIRGIDLFQGTCVTLIKTTLVNTFLSAVYYEYTVRQGQIKIPYFYIFVKIR